MKRETLANRFLSAHDRLKRLSELALAGPEERDQALETALSELALALEELEVAGEEVWSQNQELLEFRSEVDAQYRRYQGLFERAPAASLVTAWDGVIQEANQAAARMLGVPRHLLAGKPLAVFVTACDRHSFRRHLHDMKLGDTRGSWTMHLDSRGGRDVLVHALVTGTRDEEGALTGLQWSLCHVTGLFHEPPEPDLSWAE